MLLYTERARFQVEGQVLAQALEGEWRQRLCTKEMVMLMETDFEQVTTRGKNMMPNDGQSRTVQGNLVQPNSDATLTTISEEMHAEHVALLSSPPGSSPFHSTTQISGTNLLI